MIIAGIASNAYGQADIQVGEEVSFFRASPHPYSGSQVSAVVWQDTIVFNDTTCSYISVHFSTIGLDEEDKIVVRNIENTRRYEFSNAWLIGIDSFWSPPIQGNSIIIEIHVENSQGDYGYSINKLARGFTNSEIAARLGESCPYCCGDDNKLNAVCFSSLHPEVYQKSKSIGRIWKGPTYIAGSGWFWGGDGHFMTAMHVFSTGSAPAANYQYGALVQVEIMGESSSCAENCQGPCIGQFVSMGYEEVAYDLFINSGFDFTLLKLNLWEGNDSESIAYLKVRAGGPKLNEQVYIPGYPIERGKVISYYSDQSEDIVLTETLTNGLGNVHLHSIDNDYYSKIIPSIPFDITVGYGLEYYCDSEGNMSGSPVIAYQDNLVIGYHTRGSFYQGLCPNGGVNINAALNLIHPDSLPPNAIAPDCYPNWDDITISQDALIDGLYQSTGNIYIQNGAQLHVTGTLYMPEGGEIIVNRNARLAVYDGGRITVCPHSRDKWKGIMVRGNNGLAQPDFDPDPYHPLLNDAQKAGEVFIKNGYITNALKAITTSNPNNNPNQHGGVVYIDQGYFDYNNVGLEMVPYAGSNKSFVKKAIFGNADGLADNAIILNGIDAFEINESRFNYLNHEAVRVFDGSLQVRDDNHFVGCEKAISIEYTSTNPFGKKSIIGDINLEPNHFENNTHHIFVQGAPRIDILGNNLEGGISGVWIAGPTRYDINSNDFSNMDWGTVHFFNGNNQNIISNISCNVFEVKNYGSVAIGNNSRTRYWGNQFELNGTGSRDIMVSQFAIPGWVLYPGQIYQPQGDIQYPTDNCFTEPGQKIDILTNGSTIHFDFFHRPSGETTCGYEPLNPGNYTPLQTSPDLPPHDCYQFIEGSTVPENASLTELDSLRHLITELAPYTASSIDTLVWYNQVWEEKEALLHYLVMTALDTNDIAAAEQIIRDENIIAADWAIYGLRLNSGDISGAASWLAQLSDTSEVEQDFYDIQAINLAYRQDTTGSFVLDSSQISFLEGMAYGGSPVRDYARSLLGVLVGQKFYPEIPEEEGELRSVDQDVNFRHQSEDWRIYPVPANNELQIRWKIEESEDTWQIRIIDVMGGELLTQSIQAASGHHLLYLDEIRTGIFYIAISSQSGEIRHQSPFVIHR